MSDLSGSERRKLEKLLGMGGGYVLNFSDRTFGDFFDEYRVEIDAERYKARGTSKANRMRTFWDVDGNHVVGRVIGGLIEYATARRQLLWPVDVNYPGRWKRGMMGLAFRL